MRAPQRLGLNSLIFSCYIWTPADLIWFFASNYQLVYAEDSQFISLDQTFPVSFTSHIYNFCKTSLDISSQTFQTLHMQNWTIGILPLSTWFFFQSSSISVNDTYHAPLVIHLRIISDFFLLYPLNTLSLYIVDYTMKTSLKSM